MSGEGLVPGAGVSYGSNGMVASRSKRAAAAGLHVLQRGGNAFDAAIAVAGVEWLTLPAMCGLGGDMFAVLYDARNDRLAAINGSGEAARRASRDYYVSQGLRTMPLDGWHAAAVPGAPHAYATLNREFGTLPLADLLAPALAYAERGIIVSEDMSRTIAGAAGKLGQFADSAALYFPGGTGTAPRRPLGAARSGADHPGLCHRWPRGFLPRRETAAEIVRASTAGGGLFGLEEFAEQTTDVYEPLHTLLSRRGRVRDGAAVAGAVGVGVAEHHRR